jgi:hypothetical protein
MPLNIFLTRHRLNVFSKPPAFQCRANIFFLPSIPFPPEINSAPVDISSSPPLSFIFLPLDFNAAKYLPRSL